MPDGSNPNNEAGFVSLTEVLNEVEEQEQDTTLRTLRIGPEDVYISVFTESAAKDTTHYLEATETWEKGYYRCLGEGCPACRAGLEPKQYLLLPVVDRVDAQVKVLRMPILRGPGKFLTEFGKVLTAPEREKVVATIRRDRNFVYTVAIRNTAEVDPQAAAAAKRFKERVENGGLDIRSVHTSISADEMREHETIAKRLKLSGAA